MDEKSATAANIATEKAIEEALLSTEKSLTAVSGAIVKPSDALDQNEIFTKLVSGDDDIIGLVAYSLYKQNKIEWMRSFEDRRGRAPNDDEFAAYIIGENTPRRVSTYRFLAESTVSRSVGRSNGGESSQRSVLGATMTVFYGLLGVGVIAALIILARFVFSLRHG